jgi:hypothetical protein
LVIGINSSVVVKLRHFHLTDEPGGHQIVRRGWGLGPIPSNTIIYTGKLHHDRGR